MKVETAAVASLVPAASNARLHSDEQVSKIAASIKRFGFNNPILVDAKGVIVAGHGRLMAAKSLGLASVPVVRLGHLSEQERRAYTIADNKIALDAEWDEGLLLKELAALSEADFDVALTGFTEAEFQSLLSAAQARDVGFTDSDAVPEAPKNPVATSGDLWALGNHRLLCGDATSKESTRKLIGGGRLHLMVTDPPYGVEYDPDWRNRADRANGKAFGARATGKVENDDRADWREAWANFPGDVAYVWHAGIFASNVQASLEAAGFVIRCQIIWAKPRFVISRGDYHWKHEPCWYAVRKGKTGHWNGDRSQTTLWDIEHQKSDTGHGTQKPIECMKRPIENNSAPGDDVYEPFAGSGTTIIAAEMTGRKARAIEINPAYVDVCIKRWQDFTGEKAKLVDDGRSFDKVASARGVAV